MKRKATLKERWSNSSDSNELDYSRSWDETRRDTVCATTGSSFPLTKCWWLIWNQFSKAKEQALSKISSVPDGTQDRWYKGVVSIHLPYCYMVLHGSLEPGAYPEELGAQDGAPTHQIAQPHTHTGSHAGIYILSVINLHIHCCRKM